MIHAPLVLPFTQEAVTRLMPEARYVHEQYQTKRRSVYETSPERILRGLIAEDVLAAHRGARRADVRKPWATPYDVSPDIEVRCVERPSRIDGWVNVCLTLYAADAKKVERRWVLALLDYDRWDVRYLGWETGPALLARAGTGQSKEGRKYAIAGMLWPDELRHMDDLA